jgi:hypothetical protein
MTAKAKSRKWRCPDCGHANNLTALKCAECGAAKPWTRGGLHRLECPDCPCYGYFTVATLEAAGELPACFVGGCGERMVPTELELAMLLGVDAPVVEAYTLECQSIAHGQAFAVGHGHGRNAAHRLETPELKAAERVAKRRRDAALSNRLGALKPVAAPIPF